MIRFIPDDLWQALLRPLAMAIPAGNVYVEIIAPDLRFLLLFILLPLAWALGTSEQLVGHSLGRALIAYFCAAYVLWLVSSGNGRYMLPIFLMVGPAVVWLASQLALSRHVKLAVVVIALISQAGIVSLSDPLATWKQTDWTPPNGFDLEIDPALTGLRATYVTDGMPTFSILAPRFNPQSRWMNLSAFDNLVDAGENKEIAAILASSANLRWVTLATLDNTGSSHPAAHQLKALNRSASRWGLEVEAPDDCDFVKSASVVPRVPFLLIEDGNEKKLGPSGFWLCKAHYDAKSVVKREPLSQEVLAVIAAVEKSCKRFFPLDRGVRVDSPGPVRIRYPDTDMILSIYPNGEVSYVYYDSINPVKLGSVGSILSGATVPPCTRISARARMSWN